MRTNIFCLALGIYLFCSCQPETPQKLKDKFKSILNDVCISDSRLNGKVPYDSIGIVSHHVFEELLKKNDMSKEELNGMIKYFSEHPEDFLEVIDELDKDYDNKSRASQDSIESAPVKEKPDVR